MEPEKSTQSSSAKNDDTESVNQESSTAAATSNEAVESVAAVASAAAAATTTVTATNDTSADVSVDTSVAPTPQYTGINPAAATVTSFDPTTIPTPYSQPPPSYQDALSYPTSSYQAIRMGTAFPKPDAGPMPPYSTLPPVTQQQPTAAPANSPVIVTVSRVPVENCPFCRVGSIVTEFDLCLLVCLILLAIFTFPVGLLFLCCIPCTIHKRCNSCQRTVRMLEVSNLV